MRNSRTSALSYQEKLQIIEKFAVRFARCLIGGTITPPNDPYGDLRHEDGSYSEVKSAGDSAGAIIRREQLRRHCAGPTRNYVLVFRENRVLKGGRWDYPTLRRGTSQKALEKYLLATINEVYIIDKTGIRVLYQKMRRRERTYQFRTGPKSYVKMRPGNFVGLLRFGFEISSQFRFVRFEGKAVQIRETRISAKVN